MSDWTTDAVDNIERVVTTVRDKTVTPAQNVTRAIVFGLLSAFFVAHRPHDRLHRSVPAGRRLRARRGLGVVPHLRRNLRRRRHVLLGAEDKAVPARMTRGTAP